jgi:hypothetical protein
MAKSKPKLNFYDHENYKKADELIRKHATGLCIDQIKLTQGGVLEKWNVGGQIVLMLCERAGLHDEGFRVEVFHPVTTGPTWPQLDKALAALAAGNKSDLNKDFARRYLLARETNQYTPLDEEATEILGGLYEQGNGSEE